MTDSSATAPDTMDIDLEEIDTCQLSASGCVFRTVLLETLPSSKLPDWQTKSQLIADSVVRLYTSGSSGETLTSILWNFWAVVFQAIGLIPHDHPWQDILTDATLSLRQRTEPIDEPDLYGQDRLKWEDLLELEMHMLDMRQDPITCFGDQAPRNVVMEFHNLTSFAARLSRAGFAVWPSSSTGEISMALEWPPESRPESGFKFDSRLWIATEWLLRSADSVYTAFCDHEDEWPTPRELLKEGLATWLCPLEEGTCEDEIPPLNVRRWQLWRQRLVEIERSWPEWDLKDTTAERILHAVREMDLVTEQRAKGRQEQSADTRTGEVTKGAEEFLPF
ncbi:hypothetical protein Daus18300_011924 [Diaporthe australafricana]|uniref:Uncharacterized protein n=1 Tax=Diaporthe australafricana TaxID=127596 RepID=A0ABR3W4P5_9PEZI